MATIPHKLTPCRLKSPTPNAIPPIPKTRVTATITRLRDLCRSTWFLISVFKPTVAMDPNSRIMMPPMTGTGMVCSSAPSLPTKASTMAVIAAQVMIAGLNARVSITAPVTSLYVVLGGAPSMVAAMVATPSPAIVRCKPGFFR
ncbi:Uncharacterised protein [Vibrio cholerae]|nr:Uncharacterised protein [Vibrio cholerae]